MLPHFGIKLGNSTTCVAIAKDTEKIEVIANKHGDRVTQAVLMANADEIEVGLTAKQKMPSKASQTVCNSFQFLNDLNEQQLAEAIKYITCEFDNISGVFQLSVCTQGEGSPDKQISMSPYEVCVEFFKASFELARQCHASEECPSAVLSIPCYYPEKYWAKLVDAAKEAGFNVLQIISESTAALLAYQLAADHDKNKRILYIKVGGLLTSFALFEVFDGFYSMLNTVGPFYIGGKQFTDVLVEFIAKEFRKKYNLNPYENRRSLIKIRTAAENSKHILTTLQSNQIYIESLMDGADFNIQMSRARFENLIQPVINKFLTILNEALDKISPDERPIDEIVLAGGTMKIPRLQSAISTRFPKATIHISLPPDEVVAIGCARQSLYINIPSDELKPHTKCAFVTKDIYIWHYNNSAHSKLLAKSGTVLPCQVELDVECACKTKVRGNKGAIFHIKSDNQIEKIIVNNAKPINGVYQILAKIEDNDGWPSIKLTCI